MIEIVQYLFASVFVRVMSAMVMIVPLLDKCTVNVPR